MPSSPDFTEVVSTLGEKIQVMRVKRGLSQTELANRAEVQRKSLQNIEYARGSMKRADGTYGIGNPKLDTVHALARALNVDLAYLVDPAVPVYPLPD